MKEFFKEIGGYFADSLPTVGIVLVVVTITAMVSQGIITW